MKHTRDLDAMTRFIRWLDDLRSEDQLLVGQKGATLGELFRVGLEVPIGFCVTTEAYKDFIESAKLQLGIAELLAKTDLSNAASLKSSASNIKRCILRAEIPEEIKQNISEAYKQLSHQCEEDAIYVAVRSSAIAEDLPHDSFAGQYATFLNIAGVENVITKIKECWASLYSEQAIYYRVKKGYGHSKHLMAVMIQRMIPAEVSGVMFTESLTGRRNEMVINSTWGLGEPLVSGKVTSDYYIVSKDRLHIIDQHIETKENMAICNPKSGVQNVLIPHEKREISSLTTKQVRTLFEKGEKIEKHFGSPQDIEWVFLAGNIIVLQSRPITTLQHIKPLPSFPICWKAEADKEKIWTKGMGVPSRFVDPVTPLSFSLVKIILARCWEDAMRKLPIPYDCGQVEFRLFNSYLYWNIDLEQRPKFSPRLLVFLAKLWIAVRKGIDKWKQYLPEYLSKLDDLKQFDVRSASLDELYTYFKRICDLFSEYFVWEVYLGETVDVFFEIYLDVISKLTGESKMHAAKLVQGMDSKTKEMNQKLWELIRKAKGDQFVKNMILSESNFDRVVRKLHASEVGLDFVGHFDEFLEEYGHRSPKPDWFFPSWKEDPSLVLNCIREELKRKDYDFESISKKQIHERELLTSLLNDKVKHHPIKWVLFRWFHEAARRWAPMREDRQHYVKLASQLLKDTLEELNSRLIQNGVLSKPKDIWFLHLDEIPKIIAAVNAHESPSLQDIVSKRRSEWEKCFRLTPPPKIVGTSVKNHVMTKEKRLTGLPSSPGRAMGRARIISNLDEFENFRHGEILVAPETGPEWILLFGLAKAVVTDYGMPLSHSGLLAREFSIPAVCGTKIATGAIRTGEMIIVDGDNGVVVLM